MSNARVASDEERPLASQLLLEGLGVDLLQHEQHSGATVSFLVWPDSGPIQTAAAIVLYRDGTAFLHAPAGERRPMALGAIYELLVSHAGAIGAHAVIALVTASHPEFAAEVASHGFERVGFVLSMQCRERQQIQTLAKFAEPPHRLGGAPADDARLIALIDRTYAGSLSDPAIGVDHRATGFVQRLNDETADHRDRYVYVLDGIDAATCLLSRHDAARYVTVRYLGVVPEFRGRKLGGKLLAASLSAVWSRQYDYATVEVDEGNKFAVAIYGELGFRETSRAEEFAIRIR